MFKRTPAGERRHRVTVLLRDAAQDAYGQTTGYSPGPTLWAKIYSASARDVLSGGIAVSEVDHVVNILYQPSLVIRSKDRVQFTSNGRTLTFDIKAVLNLEERNLEMNLMCLELNDGVPAGV